MTTHGEFPEADAMDFHRLLLARTNLNDGRLDAEEARLLDLHETRLVTLEVCDAGLYRVGPGDEPYGLIPAFFAAGAENVLATLWPIEHEVSRHFVAAFYEQLLEAGPAEALRRASLSFIEDDAPLRHWSSFLLTGSGRPFV
jgi:CHAT domain-containing protein